ncbi:ribosomal RNA processing protein 1 homolog A isoform X3 [Lingula anatina]|uniref:Ribosomal RNA processing protein 1 homolog A isoform X3 n=1 Tax=Lingula anatina TaxID=7574 RepID=A0A1S3HXA5_LINAN|nr:ribosomal RNA processing protein 1 homolog A isoform X3 [Lingula anatina]|eukprot:XP_013390191.1 ribosomal RNA processing protein 1 homolog A isoform X3 [Lingula anatina]
MAASMQLQPAEVYFAQKLAANEKKIRDRAVKKLRKYISVRSQSVGFSEDDMLKIWKGLHYCMWMCDKPLVQEDLADTLSNLLQCFDNNAQAFLFIDAFFQTQCREWFGIDRLRLDKFMMLIRRVIHQCLLMLKIKKWKVTLVKQFLSILEKYVISDSDNAGPDGLKFHLADIYLDELSSVGIDSLKPDVLQIFLEPYCTMMTRCQNKHLVSHVVNRIFKNIIDQSDVGKDEEEDVSEDEGEEENQDTDKAPKLQFDYTAIADKLFDLAKGNNCLSRNRPAIYDLVKRFKDLAAGIFPSDDIIGSSDEDDPISNADFNMAVQRLRKVEKMGIKKKKTKKRKLEETHEGSEEEPKKKKKKKSKQVVKEDESQINGILDKEPPKKKKNKCKSEQQSKSESNDKNDELEGEGHSTTRNLANNSQKKSRKLKNAADNADSFVGGIGESNGVVSTKKDKKREK